MNILILAVVTMLSVSGILHAESPPPFVEKNVSKELLAQVREGGFVLYMRHGTTDNSIPDRVPRVDLNDCSTQRPLTDEGRKLIASVGKSIKSAGIPVTEVFASPLCRAKESAKIAFGDKVKIDNQLMYTANMTTDEKRPNLETTRRLISAPVARGGNRVIVSHAPNLADLIGYFPKPEGTVVIFSPKGAAGFEYLGSIHPDSWNKLLK